QEWTSQLKGLRTLAETPVYKGGPEGQPGSLIWYVTHMQPKLNELRKIASVEVGDSPKTATNAVAAIDALCFDLGNAIGRGHPALNFRNQFAEKANTAVGKRGMEIAAAGVAVVGGGAALLT